MEEVLTYVHVCVIDVIVMVSMAMFYIVRAYVYRVALKVEFVDGVTRLECMQKSDAFKVCNTHTQECMQKSESMYGMYTHTHISIRNVPYFRNSHFSYCNHSHDHHFQSCT